VKTKNVPLQSIQKTLIQDFKLAFNAGCIQLIKDVFSNFSFDNLLAFGMGRLFRQTHELAIIGVRGKIYNHIENKSQRSVHFHPATKHSVKPESLQDRLDIMFPKGNRLEMFARRSRNGWICVGLESPQTMGEDIRDTLNRLKQV
jgi:N6-adenosine-specific RNA methylase IME4